MKTRNSYVISVGNIGNITATSNKEANRIYKEYVRQSINNEGRASGEDVTLLINDDIVREFEGFIEHGSYTVCNAGGFLVQLSDDGDSARMKDCYGSENPKISSWKEIEYVIDPDCEDEENNLIPVIDPKGYNIPLNEVMRIN